MTQTWHRLLFAHWPVAPEALRPLVPPALPLDTFEGQCWVGIVPFYMTNVRPRFVPPMPGLSQFHEMNVRTYVTMNDKPGVYFFSLDAANPIAVVAARMIFHLPYFNAIMSSQRKDDTIHYHSRRTDRRAGQAEYEAVYGPIAPVTYAQRDSLEYWFTERYCLYTVVGNDRVYRCDIHHRKWPLQVAEMETKKNTMAISHGIRLSDTQPLLHYAHRQEVLVWPLHRVS